MTPARHIGHSLYSVMRLPERRSVLQLVCSMCSICLFFGLLLSGCQMVQRALSFPESGRDWQLGQVLSKRSELEEQYRQCLIDGQKGRKGEVSKASGASEDCSAYKAELEKPIVLPAKQ